MPVPLPLPILPEDSSGSGGDEETARRGGGNPNSSGRNAHAHTAAAERGARTRAAPVPYVTDIGYDDDDARHTVASQNCTPWEAMGQRWREWKLATTNRMLDGQLQQGQLQNGEEVGGGGNGNGGGGEGGVACGMTPTDRRMVAAALLLLSAMIVVGCALGLRNSSGRPPKEEDIGYWPPNWGGGPPQDNGSNSINEEDGGGGGGGGGGTTKGGMRTTPAPTPWTVPPFRPPTPSASSSLCASPIQELPPPPDLRGDDGLGASVALDSTGRILVVGAPRADNLAGGSALDTGAAFVYPLTNGGGGGELSPEMAKLVASDAHRGMAFGAAVGVSGNGGNVVVVGAPAADVGFAENVGAVYVFRRRGSSPDGGAVWEEEARLVPPSNPISRMQFGRSVAVSHDGTTILVGSPGGRRIAKGSAIVYSYGNGGRWAPTATIEEGTSIDGDMFGLSVDISTNGAVVVGAPLAGSAMEGMAFVYSLNVARDEWERVAQFAGRGERDELGVAVSIDRSADRVAIGAPFHNSAYGYNSGGVYIYHRNDDGVWEREALVTIAGEVTANYNLGSSVDLVGSRLIAGAPGNFAAHVFTLEDDGSWKETQRLRLEDGTGESSRSFATSVATSEQRGMAVGDPTLYQNTGSIYAANDCYF